MKYRWLMTAVLFLLSIAIFPSVSAESFHASIQAVTLEGNIISPNEDQQFDQTQLHITLSQSQSFSILVLDVPDQTAGPNGDGIIGIISEQQSYQSGSLRQVLDGTYTPFSHQTPESLPDGVYYIVLSDGSDASAAVLGLAGPLIVKTSSPKITIDPFEEVVQQQHLEITGRIEDAFLDFNAALEEQGSGFDQNEALTAAYTITKPDGSFQEDELFINPDGTFTIQQYYLTPGTYSIAVTVEDIAGNPAATANFTYESNYEAPDITTVIEDAYLEGNIISKQMSGRDLHVLLKEPVTITGVIWDAMDPAGGDFGDGTIGSYVEWSKSTYGSGEHTFLVSFPYTPWNWQLGFYVADLEDSVYTIQLGATSEEIDYAGTFDVGPFMVKTSATEIELEAIPDLIEDSSFNLRGRVIDKFIDYKETIETVYERAYEVNDYLSLQVEVSASDGQIVLAESVQLSQDGSFEIPLANFSNGEYQLRLVAADTVENSPAETTLALTVQHNKRVQDDAGPTLGVKEEITTGSSPWWIVGVALVAGGGLLFWTRRKKMAK